MKTLIDHLAQDAAYHRDPRNIHTHFVGVPMIMFAVVLLLSRPVWWAAGVPVSPALVCAVAAGAFYLRLDLRLYGECKSHHHTAGVVADWLLYELANVGKRQDIVQMIIHLAPAQAKNGCVEIYVLAPCEVRIEAASQFEQSSDAAPHLHSALARR